MHNISFREANTTLLQRLPELRIEYESESQSWAPDEIHAHIAYGSILAKFISRIEIAWQNTNEEGHEHTLQRAFLLVEDLASSSDFESRCLIEASLLETLLGEPDGWKRFSRFFRANTMKLAKKVVERFAG